MNCNYAIGKCCSCGSQVGDGVFDVRKIPDVDHGMVPNKKYCAQCRWNMRAANMTVIEAWYRDVIRRTHEQNRAMYRPCPCRRAGSAQQGLYSSQFNPYRRY